MSRDLPEGVRPLEGSPFPQPPHRDGTMAKKKSPPGIGRKPAAKPSRPENKQAIARSLELLKQLPDQPPGKTAVELHRALEENGYSVNLRSVQRDLNNLTGPFAITCDEDDTPQRTQRWYWMPQATTRVSAISQTESIALLLVEQFLTGMSHKSLLLPLQRRVEAARRFIAATDGKGAKSPWMYKFLSAPREFLLQAPKFDPEIMRVLLDALFTEKQVQILYESLNDKFAGKGERWRTLHPYVLLFKGSVSYLVAREDGGEEHIVKQYAVHRIRQIKPTTRACVMKNFDFQKYRDLESHELGEKSEVTLRLAMRHATIQKVLSEAKLSDVQVIRKEGERTIVEARVRDTNPLRRWLLAQGNRIEVLGPKGLRNYVREQLTTAAMYYAADEDEAEV